MTAPRGRPMEVIPEGPGTALSRFLIRRLPEVGLTNTELAKRLGYARPNIVTGWKTGQTKFTLDNVFSVAELLEIDPSYMLALYFDQYISDAHGGVDRFADIVEMVQRMVTPEEWEIISISREARRGRVRPLRDIERRVLKELFSAEDSEGEGHYLPLHSAAHVAAEADRSKFARRGYARDMSLDDIRRLEAEGEAGNERDGELSQLNVRIDPDLHRAMKMAALERGLTLGDYVSEVYRRTLDWPARE